MDIWPWELLTPREERWMLRGVSINGGVSTSGVIRTTRTDGGGLWVGEQSFLFHTVAQIKAARAIEAILDAGAGTIVAWSFEEPFSPGGLSIETVPHSDDTPFSDGSEYSQAPHGAVAAEAAALRATSLTVTMIAGEIQGGERFSIDHPTKGMRRYVVGRVVDDVITIRPPLREAITEGTELNFLRVGCVCTLQNAEEFMGALSHSRIIEATARWVEAP